MYNMRDNKNREINTERNLAINFSLSTAIRWPRNGLSALTLVSLHHPLHSAMMKCVLSHTGLYRIYLALFDYCWFPLSLPCNSPSSSIFCCWTSATKTINLPRKLSIYTGTFSIYPSNSSYNIFLGHKQPRLKHNRWPILISCRSVWVSRCFSPHLN